MAQSQAHNGFQIGSTMNLLSIVPVEELVRTLPLAVAFKQREHAQSSCLDAGQFAGPVLHISPRFARIEHY